MMSNLDEIVDDVVDVKTRYEYTVAVGERGYISDIMEVVGEPPVMYMTDAFRLAAEVKKQYCRFGCPEVAETVRVLVRQVVLNFKGWHEAGKPAS